MQLHQLQVSSHKARKRVGRGGKRGTTSGRGTKGQHSRAGRRIRPASRDLINRIPKLRGFRNKPKSDKPMILDLGTLSRKLAPLSGKSKITVDMNVLKQVGLVTMRNRREVKVLGDGSITFPIELLGISASASAKTKILKAGGRVIASNANDSK